MWVLLTLFLASLLFLINTLRKRPSANYWSNLGFLSLQGEVSLIDLLTGKKSNTDEDTIYYKKIVGAPCGGIVEFGNPTLFVKDLDLARDIFIKDFDHFFDRRNFPNSDPIFTDSLFFMRGQEWKNMRAFLSPTFTSGRIKRMFPHFGRATAGLKKYILRQPALEVNVSESMRKFAIEVIGGAGFGLDINVFADDHSEFYEMAERIGNISLKRKIKFGICNMFPNFANFFKISTLDRDISEYFEGLLNSSLKAREENFKRNGTSGGNDDFVQLLIEARQGKLAEDKNSQKELYKEEQEAVMKSGDKNDIQWTDGLTIAQAFLFMVAGFDTVSNNLMIVLHQLAKYPEMQEKVFQEVKDVTGDGEISYDSVNKMEYLDMFVAEVLRLYPAVSRLERKCMKDYPIAGTKQIVPAGTIVAFVTEGIHRDEKHYENPMEFRPERFTQEEKAKRHSYSYMPFGIGPRNCIGMRFALVETKAAVANIVKNFEISPLPQDKGKKGVVRIIFGYKVRHDLKLKFKPRN